jgi:hypothetical protein
MITDAGLACKLIVRPGFNADAAPPGVEVVEVDPGQIGDNVRTAHVVGKVRNNVTCTSVHKITT